MMHQKCLAAKYLEACEVGDSFVSPAGATEAVQGLFVASSAVHGKIYARQFEICHTFRGEILLKVSATKRLFQLAC